MKVLGSQVDELHSQVVAHVRTLGVANLSNTVESCKKNVDMFYVVHFLDFLLFNIIIENQKYLSIQNIFLDIYC